MAQSLCRLDDFKDNCGFGLIAHIKGKTSHKLLLNAVQALTCMTHRGGVAADGKTGDGCGLLMQKPDSFLRTVLRESQQIELPELYAVGAVMLNTDEQQRSAAKNIIEQELSAQGLRILAWREVPTDDKQLSRFPPLSKFLSVPVRSPMRSALARVYLWAVARPRSN
jgi:glutamate synthase (NADPH/NADH) large chain